MLCVRDSAGARLSRVSAAAWLLALIATSCRTSESEGNGPGSAWITRDEQPVGAAGDDAPASPIEPIAPAAGESSLGMGGTGGDEAGAAGAAGDMPATDAAVADAGVETDGATPLEPMGPPRCDGKPGSYRGRSVQTLMAGGMSRRFLYYAPESLDPDEPVPLLLVTHGFLMNGEQMADTTRFEEIADREGFVVLFPDGQGERATEPGFDGPWNVGEGTCDNSLAPLLPLLGAFGVSPYADGDDQAFVDAMFEFVRDDQCVDEDHVFQTGFSMGGYFTNENGCVRSDIRSVAPHSGGSHPLDACPGSRKPVLVLHFEQDGLIPYGCGTEARDRWIDHNGCDASATPETRIVEGGVCEYFQGCPPDGQVAMCTFQAPMDTSDEVFLGHGWSGGAADDPVISTFSIPETANASELAWEFFTEFAW